MNIIIVGATQIGYTLVENLVNENNDVTLIDTDEDILRRLEGRLDIKTIHGLGCRPDVLKLAQADAADMLIAVSQSDEVNMMACQVAYCLFRTPKKIARIQNRSYLENKKLFADDLIPVDLKINPEQLITKYIARLVSRPGALQVWDFVEGKVQLVSLRPRSGGILMGKTLADLNHHIENLNGHIAAIYRHNKPVSLSDDTVIELEDEVFFIAAAKDIATIMHSLGRLEKRSKRVMIAGGGNIGSLVAETLESKYQVKVIEKDLHRAKQLANDLQKSVVIFGDATDAELLKSENIDQVDMYCALTNDDEDNIMSCLQVKQLGAKKVMALITRSIYAELIEGKGIDVVVSPQNAAINSILGHLRHGDIENVYSIRKGESEVVELKIHKDAAGSAMIDQQLSQITLPEGVHIGAVVRESEVLYPDSQFVFKSDDHLILFVLDKQKINRLENLLQVKVALI